MLASSGGESGSMASGGIVATPADANRFGRGYAAGKTNDDATHAACAALAE